MLYRIEFDFLYYIRVVLYHINRTLYCKIFVNLVAQHHQKLQHFFFHIVIEVFLIEYLSDLVVLSHIFCTSVTVNVLYL